MKYIVAALVALSFVGVAAPVAAQSSDPACWYAFKKNKPHCGEKARQEKGGSISVSDVARGDYSTADTDRNDTP